MEKAINPDRVRFAVFQQNNKTDLDCADFSGVCGAKGTHKNHPICSRKHHIKVLRVDGNIAKGPLWARAIQDQMIGFKCIVNFTFLFLANDTGPDEDFAMQIDCHSIFTAKWDEKILNMWYKLKNEYAIITCYPRDAKVNMIQGDNVGNNQYITAFGRFTFEGKYGMPRIKNAAQIVNPLSDKTSALLVPMFGGGFSFSKAHRVRDVKNDPYMPQIFDGEEICMTHGYDFYAPSEDIIFHFYGKPGESNRPTFWNINLKETERVGKKSSARIRYLLGMKPDKAQKANLKDIGKYGMGNKRPLSLYYKMLGVNIITLECKEIQASVYKGYFHHEHHVQKKFGEQEKFR